MPPTSALKAYGAGRANTVETYTQRDLLIKLFEGALQFMDQAIEAQRRREVEAAVRANGKARKIFLHLLSTINFDLGGEIAGQLRDLYLFIVSELAQASLQRVPERIEAVKPIVSQLLEAWRHIPDEHADTTSLPENRPTTMVNITT